MERVVERELLDELPPDNPGAVGSRADIRRLNRLMGHAGILGGLLAENFSKSKSPSARINLRPSKPENAAEIVNAPATQASSQLKGGATPSPPDTSRRRGPGRGGSIIPGVHAVGMEAQTPASLVELGGGDGTFLLTLARRLAPRWPSVEVTLVDCLDVVTAETRRGIEQTGWRLKVAKADVFDWLRRDEKPADAMIANLFLHHFEPPRLADLLRLASGRTRLFAAAEPRRAWLPRMLSRLAWFIGCNAVTRHDIVVSVRAGFAGSELSNLWPKDREWKLSERQVGLTTHAFLAVG